MTARVQDKNPDGLNEDGIKKLWWAVIVKAEADLHNGGEPEKSSESQRTKYRRVLESYHWLMTDRSDLAMRTQGADPEFFREGLRAAIEAGRVVVDLNKPILRKRKVAQFPRAPRPRKPRLIAA